MNAFQLYSDLILDIEILKEQLQLANKEREQWWIDGRLFHTVPMDNAAGRVDRLTEKIEKLEEQLMIKEATEFRLKAQLARYEGLEYKVLYRRYVLGESLKDIAEDLNYNYDYIRQIAVRVRNEQLTMNSQTS